MEFQGKVAIVTGASKGIGRAIAERLAAGGASVVVNYAASRDKAEETVLAIEKAGGTAVAVRADISQVDEVERLFTETVDRWGRVDFLINNAGMMENKLLPDVTEADFDRQFALNVKGTYFACQQAMNRMSDGGSIVNFSTSIARGMFPAYSVYAATKGAVEQITRQLAKELAPRSITINAVAPGPVRTELFLTGKAEAQVEAISKVNAFQRLGEPEDIAGVVEMLISERSRWITGQVVYANGGFV